MRRDDAYTRGHRDSAVCLLPLPPTAGGRVFTLSQPSIHMRQHRGEWTTRASSPIILRRCRLAVPSLPKQTLSVALAMDEKSKYLMDKADPFKWQNMPETKLNNA